MEASTRDNVEYAARIAFFALVPFGVVLLAKLVPMEAAILNMVLALVVFFSGEMLLAAAEKRPWLRRVLRRQFAFEAYYREHAPRPFAYYVFYPLLMPYWLWNGPARREFWLFKGYTVLTVLVVSAVGAYRYFFVYQPQLDFRAFVGAFGIGLVLETLAVITLVMPMTTSVVALHKRRQKRRLVALLAVGLVSAGVALGMLVVRHRTFPSLETRQRIIARTSADPVAAKAGMKRALEQAWKVRRAGSRDAWERETDGTITGLPLEEARGILGGFFRDDEASAFELWTTARKERPAIMIVFAEGRKKGNPVWLGMKYDGTVIDRLVDVPRPARRAMRSAGEF